MKVVGQFIPPKLTTTERDAITSPQQGEVIYNTTALELQQYNGTVWESVGAGASALDDLTDVVITTPSTDDIIKYDGANWVNVNAGGNVAVATLTAWTLDAGSIYYADVTHNFNSDDVLVEIFDSVSKRTVIVEEIDRIDLNTVRVYVKGNTESLRVVLINGLLNYQGNSGRNVVLNPTNPYTAQNNDIIVWDASAEDKTVNLPPVATSNNFRIDIKKIDSTGNTITLDPNGAELIEDGSTAVMTTQYEAVTLICDGGNWWVLASV